MGDLLVDGPNVLLIQLGDFIIVLGVAGDEGTLAQVREDVLERMLVGKLFDIAQDLGRGEVGEGIFDPASREKVTCGVRAGTFRNRDSLGFQILVQVDMLCLGLLIWNSLDSDPREREISFCKRSPSLKRME